MLHHYLKISFRNLWKYKSQTLISIVGLAVGFTCFALATIWIHYEMTFDNFHKNAKQMYLVYKQDKYNPGSYTPETGYRMSSYLNETFPEIVDAMPLSPWYKGKVIFEDVDFPALIIQIDSSFFRLFDIKIMEGNRDFLIPGSNNVAITHKKSLQLFGTEHSIGKIVKIRDKELVICAVVSGMPKQSNYSFEFLEPFNEREVLSQNLDVSGAHTIIELRYRTNTKEFERKLYEHNIIINENRFINKMIIRPITKLRYTDPNIIREVKFQHILFFSVSGILVILCSLFNYLTLFISHFRIRQKEIALRKVCGASGGSLFVMLSVEFILMISFSFMLGCMLTQLIYKPFIALSDIQADLSAIYCESLFYIVVIILSSLFVFWLILLIFRKRNINISIRRTNNILSRKVSVIIQLIISIFFAFCTIIILKQIYFLYHTDVLGFSFKQRGSVSIFDTSEGDNSVLVNHLKMIPEITEITDAGGKNDLLNTILTEGFLAKAWEDKQVDAEPFYLDKINISPEYISYYNIRLVEGEMLTDIDPDSLVLINESAVKVFGWSDPVGKHLDKFTVKGVIKNVYNFIPTIEAKPVLYTKQKNSPLILDSGDKTYILRIIFIKFEEGAWKSCREKIEQLIKKEYAGLQYIISNSEEEYNKFLKSENALIKLLSFVSVICVLICVFGFVSLISLTCEERRKEIAIRKINGASVSDIISIFAKEYFPLMMTGAMIGFTVGYFIMQSWLENYVKQTSISVWIYVVIIFDLALVIVLCVGWRVYKASVEDPAKVVKRE